MGTWESSRIPKILEFDCKGHNTLLWGFLYIIGKLSKCRCRKWVRMGHLDICSTSYGKKKGWESNWQFDSRPPEVRNWPNPDACKRSATHRWKALDENYNFALDLVPIGGMSNELYSLKVAKVQTMAISGLLLGSPRTKSHSDVGAAGRHIEYCMGEGGGFPRGESCESRVARGLS